MRQILTALGVVALLGGCGAVPTETTPPTVSYQYSDDDEFLEVAERAEDYCSNNYGNTAYLLDRDVQGLGYEATFTCER